MVFTDDVADGARGLLRLGRRVQAQLAHRIDDAALHRLQAVAEEGQGAVEHHVHGVVEVGALGVLAQRQLLEAVERGAGQIGHATVIPVEGAAAAGRWREAIDYPDAAGDAKPDAAWPRCNQRAGGRP